MEIIQREPKRLLEPNPAFESVRILNLDIDNLDFDEFLLNLTEGIVFTPNVDHLIKLQKDRHFYENYLKADYRVCDSRIIQLISGFVGPKIKSRIAGSDLFPAFCRYHRNNTDNIRIFLLGGAPTAHQIIKEKVNQEAQAPLIVGGYAPPYGFEHGPDHNKFIVDMINASGATVLVVGLGAPKQENWIMRYKDQLPHIKIIMAVGATIDFEAGIQKRAPAWVSYVGLEWAFRLAQEPRRLFKRYLIDDMPFFPLILKQKLGRYKNPWA